MVLVALSNSTELIGIEVSWLIVTFLKASLSLKAINISITFLPIPRFITAFSLTSFLLL